MVAPGDPDGSWNDLPSLTELDQRRRMQVTVISPASAAFRGVAKSVVAPAHDGQVGILYGHAPMVVLLGEGELVVTGDDAEHRFQVARGFLQVVDNQVSVLAEEVAPV